MLIKLYIILQEEDLYDLFIEYIYTKEKGTIC